MMSDWTVDGEVRRTIVDQIGLGNVLSISGGRVYAIADGIELPVSSGYRVRVRYTPADDYVVERVNVRKGVTYPHGSREGIYCDQLGETAYRAGMYKSFSDEEW